MIPIIAGVLATAWLTLLLHSDQWCHLLITMLKNNSALLLLSAKYLLEELVKHSIIDLLRPSTIQFANFFLFRAIRV
jgi:hypothetical protein